MAPPLTEAAQDVKLEVAAEMVEALRQPPPCWELHAVQFVRVTLAASAE